MRESVKLREQIASFRRYVDQRTGHYQILKNQEEVAMKRFEELQVEIEELEQVRILIQETADHAREQARIQIELVVTNALQSIFGADLEFRVKIEEVRGRPEAEFYVSSTYGGDNIVETKPQDARGGGVVDVISLALRIALMELTNPKVEGPIILDEPAKHVSAEFSIHVADFLKSVSETFGRQVIMVTHNHHLSESADRAYDVEIKDGASVVRRVE